MIEARAGGKVREWSRHGTDLTARPGSLLAPFTDVAPGTTFDGELVAVSERDGKPIQDFAAVTRAVFTGQPAATDRLRFVGLRSPGRSRRRCSRSPVGGPGRVLARDAAGLRADPPRRVAAGELAAHEAIVALRFQGTVLKRLGSAYRPGRDRTWIKQKARFTAHPELYSVHQDRDGCWHAICQLDDGISRGETLAAGSGATAGTSQYVWLCPQRGYK